jgi:hypothetical protein
MHVAVPRSLSRSNVIASFNTDCLLYCVIPAAKAKSAFCLVLRSLHPSTCVLPPKAFAAAAQTNRAALQVVSSWPVTPTVITQLAFML